ncbi:MAG: dihydropteroate synthase [Chitinophagales bacterium]
MTNPSFSINCNGRLITIEHVMVMGILNATPDSFYDGGQFKQLNYAVEHAAKMLAEGADIIDVGGVSTRPDAKEVSQQEEMDRVLPLIEKLGLSFKDVIISIDTFRSEVAKEALKLGAHIVNDISGGSIDAQMFETVAQLKCPYILSHIQGTPQTMQLNPQYEDVVLDVVKELSLKVKQLEDAGVHDIIIDPGFGFGKTIEQNYELLAGLPLLNRAFKYPILLGLSRKSMLYKPLGLTPQESLNATTAAHMIALQNGAQLLRVHDVKEAKQAIQLWELSQAGL